MDEFFGGERKEDDAGGYAFAVFDLEHKEKEREGVYECEDDL